MIVVNELIDSREFSTADGFTATRKFLVYDNETIASADEIIDAAELPAIGSLHPDFIALAAKSYSASPSATRAGVWEIRYDYSLPEAGEPGETEDQTLPLTITTGVTAVDMYKSDPDLPANINDPVKDADIGGTLEAEGGQPVSYWLPNAQIKISETIEAESFNAARLLSSSGKRNSRPFLGLNIGSVVCKGVGVTRSTPEVYKVDYEFGWDAWYHLRQVPERGQNGLPVRNLDDTEMEVYWRQPFKETIDFGYIDSI